MEYPALTIQMPQAADLSDSSTVSLDRSQRPPHSYKELIIEAIEKSPQKQLMLKEIYAVIALLYPYYRTRADQWGWQNSIRHNLSLHDCFEKVPLRHHDTTLHGPNNSGHYWRVVNVPIEKQNLRKRVRKQQMQPRLVSRGNSSRSVDASPSPASISPTSGVPTPSPLFEYLNGLTATNPLQNSIATQVNGLPNLLSATPLQLNPILATILSSIQILAQNQNQNVPTDATPAFQF